MKSRMNRSSARGLWLVLVAAALAALTACTEEPSDNGAMSGAGGSLTGGVGGAMGPTGGMSGVAGMMMSGGMGGVGGAAGGGAGGMAGGVAGMGGMPGGMGGGGGMGATGPTYEPKFSAIFKEILTNGMTGNCMAGFCHGGAPSPTINGNLRIAVSDPQGAYDNLVNKVSAGGTMCEGKTLVIPGDSANSLLLQKLSATPPCGMRMPIGLPLDDMQMMQIKQWIDLGAPND